VEEIVSTAGARTAARVSGEPGLHVLAIEDTTTLRDDGDKRSLNAHPTIAVAADTGALLGLVALPMVRRIGGRRGARDRNSRAFVGKESHRWLDGAEAAAGLRAAAAAMVTVMADREGDIYELFANKPDAVELLVRSNHDRLLSEGSKMSDRLEA
jgi:hypothetical protein